MRYRRLFIPGGCYFFTINLAERKNNNLLIREIQKLKSAIAFTKRRHPFILDAIVVLPDHFHLIMTLPDYDQDFSLRIRLIKNYFSRSIPKNEFITPSRARNHERGIWQRRFWEHYIRNENDLMKHIDYIHYNPVKHGYVSKPVEWKFSSLHHFIQKGILTPDWSSG